VSHPLDRENIEAVIQRSPEQFHAGLRAAASVPREALAKWGKIQRILFAGMGGSSMPGALVRDAGLSTVRIDLHQGYDLPRSLPRGTLVVASSYSGTTEETLSSYQAAKQAGVPLVGISTGGELERRCATDGVPFIKIPADPPTMQPRSATGYGVGIFTQLLANLGLAAEGAVAAIERLGLALAARMDAARGLGEALVPALTQATPIIYASDRFATVARIFKIKINENAKTPAFWNVFPELNHNDMIGWTNPHGRFHLVLLRDADDHPRVLRRFDVTLALVRETGVSASILPIEGATLIEKFFSTLLVEDWASYGLALALGIDPSPVSMVEELKKRLKE
jgi:glucose/mannose-6-phosphate isomerase